MTSGERLRASSSTVHGFLSEEQEKPAAFTLPARRAAPFPAAIVRAGISGREAHLLLALGPPAGGGDGGDPQEGLLLRRLRVGGVHRVGVAGLGRGQLQGRLLRNLGHLEPANQSEERLTLRATIGGTQTELKMMWIGLICFVTLSLLAWFQ